MLAFNNGMITRSVGIEIVGFCNANCTFCPAGSDNISSKTKFMDVEYFEEIVRHFLSEKILVAGQNVGLFHTSEAFLHQSINSVFDVLEKYHLKAQVSSNFIRYPKLEKRHYKNLGTVTFSLCSFQKDRYKKVYGADIEKVLDNFNSFVKEVRDSGANIDIQVNWIRYRDNQDEEEYAKHYFQTVLGVKLNIISAILLDIEQYADILIDNQVDKLKQFDNEMLLSEQLEHMRYAKSLKAPFAVCEEFFNIVIDVDGNWVRCCRTTNRQAKNLIGTFKDVNIKVIQNRKTDDDEMCRFCSSHYIPDSAYLVESATNIQTVVDILDIKENDTCVIYGSGHLAQVLFGVIQSRRAGVLYFVDDTKNGKLFNVDVISFEEFERIYSASCATVIISATNSLTIAKIKDKIFASDCLKKINIISL
jgi:pyruvate-formate lyase-activating enzyme